MKIATVSILLLLPLSNVRSDEPVEIPICRRTDDGTGTPTFEPLVVSETLPDDIEMFDFATNRPVALTPPLLEDLCGGNYNYNFGESSRCAGYCCASAWNSPYYVVPECDGKQDPGECEVVLVDNHYPNVGYGQYCSVGLGYWVHHSEGCWTGNDNTDTVKVGPNTTFQWCIHVHGSGCQPKVTGPTTVDVSGRGLTEVFVFDETPPTITCPADGDVAVTEDCSLPPDFKATVTDNCYDGAWEESPTTSGPVPSLGSHVIEFSTSDRSGNPASCSTTVTLVNQTPPTITCPANPFLVADGNCEAALPADFKAAVTDNCDGSWDATPPNDASPLEGSGPHHVSFSAEDLSNNQAEPASCTVTVEDKTPPTITCPTESTLVADENCEAVLPQATATDNCDGMLDTTPDDASPLKGSGTYEVKFFARDLSNNKAEGTCSVTVEDHTPPTIVCPAATVLVAEAGCKASLPTDLMAKATDNCDGSWDVSPDSTEVLVGLHEHTVVFSTSDRSGNVATACSTEVTLIDEDDDGVCGDDDMCPDTVEGDTVDSSGCSVAQRCPCDHSWKKHKEYLDCVGCVATALFEEGIIEQGEMNTMVVAACKSSCGIQDTGSKKSEQKDKCDIDKLKFIKCDPKSSALKSGGSESGELKRSGTKSDELNSGGSKSNDETLHLAQDHATSARHRWLRGAYGADSFA